MTAFGRFLPLTANAAMHNRRAARQTAEDPERHFGGRLERE
jgi:hypothetical protein